MGHKGAFSSLGGIRIRALQKGFLSDLLPLWCDVRHSLVLSGPQSPHL